MTMGGRVHIDISGQIFGRLKAIKRVGNGKNGQVRYECKCSCGTVVVKLYTTLSNGNTKSCGCYNKELGVKRFTTHGKSEHPLYGVWTGMMQRCYNKKSKSYLWYGGCGITVCDEWLFSFENFYDWGISSGWEMGLTIERLNIRFSYSPYNCTWIHPSKQNRNKRSSRLISHNGITMCLTDWADKLNIPASRISRRINSLKWPIEKCLSTIKFK